MALDITYTNGVIAAKEKNLLGDFLLRLCETDAADAFRALCERGYGGGAETTADVYEYEKLIEKEESRIDAFVCEYAPSDAEKIFFLSRKDFHNAKALLKAAYLKTDVEKMLAGEGLVSLSLLKTCVESGDFSALERENPRLKLACEAGRESLQKERVSGAEIGEIFEKAHAEYLWEKCRKNKTLKKLLKEKADMTNLLTAFRCQDKEDAENKYLPMGNLSEQTLGQVFSTDTEQVRRTFSDTAMAEFVGLCLDDREKGLPPVQAEKMRDGYETDYFHARRYELQKNQPFLYYVSRCKTENANVRIVFACKLAGFGETQIKARLRGMK